MKVKTIRSSWWEGYGYRLDCQPYLQGALETKIILEALSVRKDPLHTVTAGHDGGIYNGPQFTRHYVDSPEFGVPFMGSSAMLRADLSGLPLFSTRHAQSDFLAHLELKSGMTLISCAGTIGRCVYARPEMVGMWSSQHIMKVVPDSGKIPPGYLYAFLSSKFGIPLVVSGTYGSIIQSIEPEHIADIPVPRFDHKIERRIHDLVEEAADALTQHSALMNRATTRLLAQVGIGDMPPIAWWGSSKHLGWAQSASTADTLRARNFDPRITVVLAAIRARNHCLLGELCEEESFKGRTSFKRVDSDPEFGLRLVGQREAFQVRPEGRWIASGSVKGLGLVVPAGSTLIASHGTLGEDELYCRAVYASKRTSEYAYSGDFYRCIPREGLVPPGYLFAYLRSDIAFRMLRSMSTGGKQQSLHPTLMYNMPVPRLGARAENEIANLVNDASIAFDHYLDNEEAAWSILESELRRKGT